MNKQRKVLITITYNEMGIIIDTKAEEVAQPNLQRTCNELATDCISRQAAIDAFDGVKVDEENCTEYDIGYNDGIDFAISKLSVLPPAQPEPCEDAVSRQAAIDWLKNEWNGMVTSLFDGIKALPAAQPNIIRCGECRHLHDNDCPVVGWGRDDDDYCAWAERDNDG